ncbi:MAG: hypothetical protein AB1Z16_09720 [Desulfotignum sp.]
MPAVTRSPIFRLMDLLQDNDACRQQIKKLGSYCEKTAAAFFDAVMTTTLQCSGLLEKRKLADNF